MRCLVLLCALLLPLAGCFDFAALLGARPLADGAGPDLPVAAERDSAARSPDAWPDAASNGKTAVDGPRDSGGALADLSASPDLALPRDLSVVTDLWKADLTGLDQLSAPDLRGIATVHNYAVPAGPIDVRVGDVNGDSFPDLVVLCGSSKQVVTLINDGSGMFGYSKGMPLVLPASGGLLAEPLDCDGDKKLDVVVTLPMSTDLQVASGRGDGTFAIGARIGLPGLPISIATADFNLDNRPDVAVGIQAMSTGVTVLLGGLNGLQAPGSIAPAGDSPAPLVAADLDGDGKPDLIAGESSFFGSSIALLKGMGTGKFVAPVMVPGAPINGIRVADFDLDGRMDLACGDQPNVAVAQLMGKGNLVFGAPVLSPAPGRGQAHLAVADFNLDGNPDVAVVERDSAQVSVFDGSGKLGLKLKLRTSYPTGATPTVVRMADFDRDGRPDLVTVNTMMPGLTVVLHP